MKKIFLATFIAFAMTFTIAATSDIAYAHCGKCGIEGAEKAGCVCDGKKWYNPMSWFKDCKVCDLKKAAA